MTTKRSDNRSNLEAAFNPRSIAVLGASADKTKMGGRVLSAIVSNGYAGDVYPINLRAAEIAGRPAFKSLADVGKSIDLVVICVPQELVEESSIAAGEAGARSVVVFASGYAEKDSDGAAAQERLVAIARRYDFALIGPNCLGMINGAAALAATSSIMMDFMTLKGGRLALVTQSGALGSYWLDEVLASGLGVGKWISAGNEAETTVPAILDYLVGDPETLIASAYLEGIRDGTLFRRMLDSAAQCRKPVILLRSGRTAAGAQAVASHTGSLAGEDVIVSALIDQYGACQVNSITEMVDVARVFANQSVQPGRRACVISISGGAGALLADAASASGFTLPDLPQSTVDELKTFFPDYARLGNPVDLTDRVIRDDDMLGKTLKAVMKSDAFDTLLVFVSGRNPKAIENYTRGAVQTLPKWRGNHAVVWKAGSDEILAQLQGQGVTVFTEVTDAVTALARATRVAERWDVLKGKSLSYSVRDSTGATFASEHRSKAYLKGRAGLIIPPSVLVRNEQELQAAFASLEAPFAVKLQSPDMLHKSGHGGIALGVADFDELTRCFRDMRGIAQRDKLRFEGVLVEQMTSIAHEFILGLRIDPTFGPLMIFGRGGIAVEVDPDVVRSFLPLDAASIEVLIGELRLAPLLKGFRGEVAVDLEALSQMIARLADLFMSEPRLTEIEINPLTIDRNGNAWALDALVSFKGDLPA